MEKTQWKYRRALMFITVIFCMVMIWRSAGLAGEVPLTIVKYSFWLIGSVMAIYVFAVVGQEEIKRFIECKYSNHDHKDLTS